jgi:hypothetical protein
MLDAPERMVRDPSNEPVEVWLRVLEGFRLFTESGGRGTPLEAPMVGGYVCCMYVPRAPWSMAGRRTSFLC